MARSDGLPDGPQTSSFAQLRAMVERPYAFYWDAYQAHGPLFTVQVLGQAPWVIVGDPEAVRVLFRASADEVHGDADAMKFLLGPGVVLFLDGEAHRRERRILTPPFKHERMAVYAARMIARTEDALAAVHPGQSIVAIDWLQGITLDVICECVFGVAAASRRSRLAALLARHLTSMQTPLMGGLAMALGGDRIRGAILRGASARAGRARLEGALPDGTGPLGFLDTKAEMDAMLRDELARCRGDEARDDILALLARATYEDGRPMADDALLDELFALLLGGHETSAITLAWTLDLLAAHPDALARLRAELDEALGDGPLDARVVDRLPYLGAVIDETLRLRPVATSLPRRLTRETELAGHRLPAGTRTFPAPAILHFRDDLWPDARAFRPERFLDGRPSPFHFFPFGGGSRACLGRPFAMVEMRLILASVVRALEFTRAPGAPTVPAMRGILTGPSDGVPLVVSPRGASTRTRRAS